MTIKKRNRYSKRDTLQGIEFKAVNKSKSKLSEKNHATKKQINTDLMVLGITRKLIQLNDRTKKNEDTKRASI